MSNGPIQIEVVGLDKIIKALDKFPNQMRGNIQQAGDEAAKRVILNTEGLQKYPPMTAANAAPPPYYIRGVGTQLVSKNTGGSEKLGTQFYVEKSGAMDTLIGNRASYAPYVVGENQAQHMGKNAAIPKGWRILREVAEEKIGKITKVYQAWVNKTIRDLGL